MFRVRVGVHLELLLFSLLVIGFTPSTLWAQAANSGSIVGKVVDSSGAAIPNVSVRATSPALQVPQVTTVTDSDGDYRLLDLPAPGVYRVTFEVQGFETLVREDIHLSVGFAARVDSTMKIGTVTTSVEVSGGSPVVDTVSTTGQTTLQQDQIVNTPRGMGLLDMLPLAAGISLVGKPDVGDSNLVTDQNIVTYGVQLYPTLEVEGINITSDHFFTTSVYLDAFSLAETEFKSSGNTADVAWPGVDMSSVMKSGSNDFHGSAQGDYENSAFQGNNITPALAAQGLKVTNPIRHYWDGAGDFGGRLIRDKLWFYGGLSKQLLQAGVLGFITGPDASGCYVNCTDSTPGTNTSSLSQYNFKVSYQITPTIKLTGVYDHAHKYIAASGASRTTPFPSTLIDQNPEKLWKGEVQSAPNTHLLIDAVGGFAGYIINEIPQAGTDVAGDPATVDSNTGVHTGPAPTNYHRPNFSYNGSGTISYLPAHPFLGGTHQLKVGTYLALQENNTNYLENASLAGDYSLTFNKGVPTTITTYNFPVFPINRQRTYAGFAMDTWTVKRVTLNLGLRVERYNGYYPSQSKKAGQFSVAENIPGADINIWNDIVPRVGAAWDVNGNGKTVVKASFGIFGDSFGPYQAGLSNGNNLITTNYSWVNAAGTPGPCLVTAFKNDSYTNTSCDATPATLASLSPTNTSATGYAFISASGGAPNFFVNPSLKPDKTFEYTAKLERQLVPNVALSLTFVRHEIYNLYYSLEPTTDTGIPADTEVDLMSVNTLRPYSDWNLTTTQNDALTGAPVTIYYYPSSVAGSAFNKFEIVNAPSNRPDIFNSFEVSVNKRYSKRWDGLASFWLTKNHEWIQQVSLSPNDDRFPIDNTWNWEARGEVTYYAPHGFQVSSYYRAQSGFAGQRTELFTGIPQLSTVTLRMGPFGQYRGPFVGVLNLKVSRVFHLGEKMQLEPNFQIFNILNTSAATSTSYLTSTFGQVSGTVAPRVARIGAYFTF